MTSSCSPWMVATMSPNLPDRDSSSAEMRAPCPLIVPESSASRASPKNSSSMPRSVRPDDAKCRRRTIPIGWPVRWPDRTVLPPAHASRPPRGRTARRTLRCARCRSVRRRAEVEAAEAQRLVAQIGRSRGAEVGALDHHVALVGGPGTCRRARFRLSDRTARAASRVRSRQAYAWSMYACSASSSDCSVMHGPVLGGQQV